jgi:hypothetical protein
VQSNRTVQRETQICDKHSNKKFKLLFSHVTQKKSGERLYICHKQVEIRQVRDSVVIWM